MAKIFKQPSAVKSPSYSNWNREEMRKEEERYENDLRDFLTKNGCKGKNFGKTISFPVADGYASYMVASMRPLELIHMEIGDCYHFKYAHLLNAKEVQAKIDKQEKMRKIFGGG